MIRKVVLRHSLKHLRHRKGKQRAIPTMSSSSSSQPGVTPSETQGRAGGSTKYEEATEWSLLVANVTKDVSEATGILAPLKSTMALLIRGLEITRVCLPVYSAQMEHH